MSPHFPSRPQFTHTPICIYMTYGYTSAIQRLPFLPNGSTDAELPRLFGRSWNGAFVLTYCCALFSRTALHSEAGAAHFPATSTALTLANDLWMVRCAALLAQPYQVWSHTAPHLLPCHCPQRCFMALAEWSLRNLCDTRFSLHCHVV